MGPDPIKDAQSVPKIDSSVHQDATFDIAAWYETVGIWRRWKNQLDDVRHQLIAKHQWLDELCDCHKVFSLLHGRILSRLASVANGTDHLIRRAQGEATVVVWIPPLA
jgi:hypothetical protein